MNISTFFKLLQAPLKCTRQSWGSVRADGKVILRIDCDLIVGGEVPVYTPNEGSRVTSFGKKERMDHLTNGRDFYCVAYKSSNSGGRGTIVGFDKRELWYGSRLRTDEQGNIWLRLSHRVAVGELI